MLRGKTTPELGLLILGRELEISQMHVPKSRTAKRLGRDFQLNRLEGMRYFPFNNGVKIKTSQQEVIVCKTCPTREKQFSAYGRWNKGI